MLSFFPLGKVNKFKYTFTIKWVDYSLKRIGMQIEIPLNSIQNEILNLN